MSRSEIGAAGSTIKTLAPSAPKAQAAVSPAMPAPEITMSKLRWVISGEDLCVELLQKAVEILGLPMEMGGRGLRRRNQDALHPHVMGHGKIARVVLKHCGLARVNSGVT